MGSSAKQRPFFFYSLFILSKGTNKALGSSTAPGCWADAKNKIGQKGNNMGGWFWIVAPS